MPGMPIFGERVEGCPYVVRPSAYAVVRNVTGHIAVVRTAWGYYLPGGGMEVGETAEAAVARECMEECGLRTTIIRAIGEAVEIVYSKDEDTCFEKTSTFVECGFSYSTGAEEHDHKLLWIAPETAVAELTHGSHRWAVQRWLQTQP